MLKRTLVFISFHLPFPHFFISSNLNFDVIGKNGNAPTFSKLCFFLFSHSFFLFSIPKTKFRCNWGKMVLDPHRIFVFLSFHTLFTIFFTIFSSPHPNFGVLWKNMGLEATSPLICKNKMIIDQQPANTNICFSHFSDKFTSHFSHPQIQILARHGNKWTLTNVVSFTFHIPFFHFLPIHESKFRGS